MTIFKSLLYFTVRILIKKHFLEVENLLAADSRFMVAVIITEKEHLNNEHNTSRHTGLVMHPLPLSSHATSKNIPYIHVL